MTPQSEKTAICSLRFLIKPECQSLFRDWQGKLNAKISAFPGFVSLEISNYSGIPNDWTITERFHTPQDSSAWEKSKDYNELKQELHALIDKNQISETRSSDPEFQGSVTEVFVTQIHKDQEKAYQEWMAKIHQIEAKFEGFRGIYVQSPQNTETGNWITFLQFDTPKNLDRWLASKERENILRESTPFIHSLESHRILSPYAGWFSSVTKTIGTPPPAWKQSMIVLLVLYPIVMLEMKYLKLLTGNLNTALSTFIGNMISVGLLAWPCVPFAIKGLRWWLSPNQGLSINFAGILLIVLLYIISIAIFWT